MNSEKASQHIRIFPLEDFPARRTAELGFLLALGLVLHWVEGFFPPPVPLPGVKLGLANLVPLVLIISGRPREAFWVGTLRIVLGSILGGSFLGIAFLMSLAGGWGSFLGMLLLSRRTRAPLSLSLWGAFCHNLGQWGVAFWYLQSWGLLLYLPVLLGFSLPAGLLVGYLGSFCKNQRFCA